MKKLLITGVAAMSLFGLAACGDSKEDPAPENVDAGVVVTPDAGSDVTPDAGSDVTPDAGSDVTTDAGEDEGDASVEEPKGCLAKDGACDLGQKCDQTTGDCVDDESIPAEVDVTVGDACDASFVDHCTKDNELLWCNNGTIYLQDCENTSEICRSFEDSTYTMCYPKTESECDPSKEYGAGCLSEFGYEFVVARNCIASSSGWAALNYDYNDYEACDYNCIPDKDDSVAATCGKLDERLGTECSASDADVCSNGLAMTCYYGEWVAYDNCNAYDGAVCGIVDDESGCFDGCDPVTDDKTLICDYTIDFSSFSLVELIGESTCEPIGNDQYGWIPSDEIIEECMNGCDDSGATPVCVKLSENEGKPCDEATFANTCYDADIIEMCYGGKIVAMSCSENNATEGCMMSKSGIGSCQYTQNKCTSGDEDVSECDSGVVSNWTCAEMVNGSFYYWMSTSVECKTPQCNEDYTACYDVTCETVGDIQEDTVGCYITTIMSGEINAIWNYVCTEMDDGSKYYIENLAEKCPGACNADYTACADSGEPPVPGECVLNADGPSECGVVEGAPVSYLTYCDEVDGKLQYVKDEMFYDVCDDAGCNEATGCSCINNVSCMNDADCANNTNGKTICDPEGGFWAECIAPTPAE